MHGGVIATLLDTAAGCSVHSTLAPGERYTSLDLTVKFLRPVTVDSGRLRCEGSVIQRGRRTALAQAQLYDAQRPPGRPRHLHLHDLHLTHPGPCERRVVRDVSQVMSAGFTCRIVTDYPEWASGRTR